MVYYLINLDMHLNEIPYIKTPRHFVKPIVDV